MGKLSASHQSFIESMNKSEEHARKGFELLSVYAEPEIFFDAIEKVGLFSADNNPSPVPADDPGYVKIPYWGALDYLEAVAKRADTKGNIELANKVMKIIREVTEAAVETSMGNYHTWRKFAEVLGYLPSEVVTITDLDLLTVWLNPKGDTSGVAHAVGRGILKKFLASDSAGDLEKACRVLSHCTSLRFVSNGEGREELTSVIDPYWFKELINNHAESFGRQCGEEAAKIFWNRIREVFQNETTSVLIRPAVEKHQQNNEWKYSENALVEGLRDVVLAWVTIDSTSAEKIVSEMVVDDNEMIRRIGIYILDQCWSQFSGIFDQILKVELFTTGHIHELYHLLQNHFEKFDGSIQKKVIDVLRQLPLRSHLKDPERALQISQRQWLSAVIGKRYKPADRWYNELNADSTLGTLSDHPDFHIYTESFVGTGPSPYRVPELIAFAENETLIEKLNSFVPKNSWRGPSRTALVGTLEEAVQQAPDIFLQNLSKFFNADRPYQYGIINGFRKYWNKSKGNGWEEEWFLIWPELLIFIESIISEQKFWLEEVSDDSSLTPTRDWIPSIVAELLQDGTKDDKHAYHPDLLPHGWRLIQILLEHTEKSTEPSKEAMSQAINAPRGKAIEALFLHALRVCRLADKKSGNHKAEWEEIRPVIDAELANCKNDNYEFSTLSAGYINNLEYLDKKWLEKNVAQIFPHKYSSNFSSALNGYSYTPASRSIYNMLVNQNIIDQALSHDFERNESRERLIQRICLSYLWGDENLDSPRLALMFKNRQYEDLEKAAKFFWSLRDQDLKDDQKKNIIEFWQHCTSWADRLSEPPKQLLSSLGLLSCYLLEVTTEDKRCLIAVAPYINADHNFTFFIEELNRLADSFPVEINTVLGQVLESYSPLYDYNDHLKTLLIKLIDAGKQIDVLAYVEHIRNSLPQLAGEIFSLVKR